MKRCVRCGEEKPLDEFAWRWKSLGIKQKACRDCRREENSQWYERHGEEHRERVRERTRETRQTSREFLWDYLSTHPCVVCGESDPTVLEFDHVNGKDRDVSAMAGQGYSIKAIKKEIAKCQVLCANCHRRKTSEERGWFSK